MRPRGYSSIGDYYRHGPYKVYARECRAAGSTPIDLVRVSQPAGSFPDPPLPAVSVLMVARGVIKTRVCLGDKPFTRLQWPGMFVVAPPDTGCDYEVSAPHEILVVALPLAAVTPLLESVDLRLSHLEPLHLGTHRDSFLEQLCHRLFDEAAAESPLGELFGDHALVALLSTLVRLAGRKAPGMQRHRHLPAARLRRVFDYLYDNLAGAVALADLAAVAHMSVFEFARQFRGAVGEAPHQYLIRQRVERAKLLLRAGQLSMAQVAAAVGFADQSHLIRHFKRIVGETPGQFLQGNE